MSWNQLQVQSISVETKRFGRFSEPSVISH
jgi:hypothetical protein